MSAECNYSKALLEFIEDMKKVITDLEALIDSHPICDCNVPLSPSVEENKGPAQQDNTKPGNDSQAKPRQNRKRHLSEE